jgi:hypothetical protein
MRNGRVAGTSSSWAQDEPHESPVNKIAANATSRWNNRIFIGLKSSDTSLESDDPCFRHGAPNNHYAQTTEPALPEHE